MEETSSSQTRDNFLNLYLCNVRNNCYLRKEVSSETSAVHETASRKLTILINPVVRTSKFHLFVINKKI
jgi:hypothetical protein